MIVPLGFAGQLGRVILWPLAFSATRAKASYRQQNDLAQWAGVSGENNASDANRAPTAVPVNTTATGGVASTIDVIARAYDPDGDALSITPGSLTPSTGTASIVSDKIAWTPAGSFTGAATVDFAVRDGAGKSSASKVYATVAAPPPPTAELPTAGRTVPISSDANLAAYFAGALAGVGAPRPGDRVVLATSGVTYGSHNVPASVSGNAGNPIVITPETGFADFNGGTVTLNGTDIWLHRLDVHGASARVRLVGSRTRLLRSKIRDVLINSVVMGPGADTHVAYCEFDSCQARIIGCSNSQGERGLRVKIYRNYLHDSGKGVGTTSSPEGIRAGETQQPNGEPVRWESWGQIRFNLFKNINQPPTTENETISTKSSRWLHEGNTLRTCRNLMLRFSNDTVVARNYCINSAFAEAGIFVRGDRNRIIANWVGGTGTMSILIASGNQTTGVYTPGDTLYCGHVPWTQNTTTEQDVPFCRDTELYYNNGIIRLGHQQNPTYCQAPTGTKISNHTGAINTFNGATYTTPAPTVANPGIATELVVDAATSRFDAGPNMTFAGYLADGVNWSYP